MICTLYSNGEEINRIVADEAFCKMYCAENGYTYEMEPEPEPVPTPPPEPQPTTEDVLKTILGG